jgi:membrane-associated phospholipid phosphatase
VPLKPIARHLKRRNATFRARLRSGAMGKGKKRKAIKAVEKADIKVARKAAAVRETPPIAALGKLGELGDQPPMVALCAATIAIGLYRRDGRLAATGVRMLAAHALATGIKHVIKRSVDRTRPRLLVEEGRYETGPGRHKDGEYSSFPSGHTAGAVAVARAYARDHPEGAWPAYAGAAMIAGVQVPRCHHFPSDIGAGAVIGLAAEAVVSWGYDRLGLGTAIAARVEPVR